MLALLRVPSRHTKFSKSILNFASTIPYASRMKKMLHSVSVLFVSMLLSSCFEMSSVVTVNKDGSGTVEETTLVSAQIKAMMGSMANAPKGEGGSAEMKMDILPTKEKAAAKAAKMGEGVTLKSQEDIKSPDGREGVKVVYAFKDVTKLKYEPGDMKDKAEDGKPSITFGYAGDTLTINLPQDKPKATDAPKEKAPSTQMPKDIEAQMAMMKPMFAGMRMSFKVKGGSGIASTDASHLEGDTVTIMEMNFDKLLEKPEGMKKFAEMSENKDMTPTEAAEAFKGLDGIKIETKEKITVKLK